LNFCDAPGKYIYQEVNSPLVATDMMESSPALNRPYFRIIFISLWYGILSFLYLYAFPFCLLKSSLPSLDTAGWISGIIAMLVFTGMLLLPQVDIKLVFTYSIAHLLLTGILCFFYAVFVAYIPSPSPDGQNLPLLFFYFLLALTFVVLPLGRISRKVADCCMPDNQPDYRDLLCNFSGKISSALHMPNLIDVLISDLPKQLHITSVGIMIMEEKCSRLYPENLRFGSHLWSKSRLFSRLRDGEPFLYCSPVADDLELSAELAEIKKAGFALVYGLQGGAQFGGMLLLGPKKDGRGYSRRDVQVFSTLANQVTIALENALNYETLSKSKNQLQLLYNKLVQAEKMAALGEMTAILAHELQNPLAIIRSSAQFLAGGGHRPEMQEKLLHYIVDEVDNLNLVVTNLLGLARHKPPRFRKVDLKKELVESTSQWIHSGEHNRKIQIHLSLPDHLPVLYADFKQIQQVLINCLANSEEVMPDGGEITITARQLDNDRVEIRIADTGPGVAEDDLKLVFKKFFTTKTKGVGLGLPVCRQIVRAHNGSIALVNNPDKGASIILHLPLRPLITIGVG